MIGPNSPATPAARVYGPSGVSSSPASRRIGISVPIAVVQSATPISRVESTNPVAWSTPAIASASPSEITQPTPPSLAGRPRIRSKSISMPARKKRNARPVAARKSTIVPGSTIFSTCGPTRIPAMISTTTTGTRTERGMSTSSGAAAAITTITSRLKSWSSIATSRLRPAGPGIPPG